MIIELLVGGIVVGGMVLPGVKRWILPIHALARLNHKVRVPLTDGRTCWVWAKELESADSGDVEVIFEVKRDRKRELYFVLTEAEVRMMSRAALWKALLKRGEPIDELQIRGMMKLIALREKEIRMSAGRRAKVGKRKPKAKKKGRQLKAS